MMIFMLMAYINLGFAALRVMMTAVFGPLRAIDGLTHSLKHRLDHVRFPRVLELVRNLGFGRFVHDVDSGHV